MLKFGVRTACPTRNISRLLSNRRSFDQKVVQLFARSKLRREPARLLTATRPGLSRVFRVSILGEDFRIRATLAIWALVIPSHAKRTKPILKPRSFCSYFAAQFGDKPLMKIPQLIYGHRFQIIVLHFSDSEVVLPRPTLHFRGGSLPNAAICSASFARHAIGPIGRRR
jgi:hypothetical protein